MVALGGGVRSVLTIAKLGVVGVVLRRHRASGGCGGTGWPRGRWGLGEYYSESETRLPVWFSAGRDAAAARV